MGEHNSNKDFKLLDIKDHYCSCIANGAMPFFKLYKTVLSL